MLRVMLLLHWAVWQLLRHRLGRMRSTWRYVCLAVGILLRVSWHLPGVLLLIHRLVVLRLLRLLLLRKATREALVTAREPALRLLGLSGCTRRRAMRIALVGSHTLSLALPWCSGVGHDVVLYVRDRRLGVLGRIGSRVPTWLPELLRRRWPVLEMR